MKRTIGRSMKVFVTAACLLALGSVGDATAQSTAIDGSRIQVDAKADPNGDSVSIRGVVTAAPGSDPVAEALAPGKGIGLVVFGSDLTTVVGDYGWGAVLCKSLASGRGLKCSDSMGRRISLSSSAAKPGIYRVNAFVPRINLYVDPPFALPLAVGLTIPDGGSWLGTTTIEECKTQRDGNRAICKAKP
jgi:hypothetical protein